MKASIKRSKMCGVLERADPISGRSVMSDDLTFRDDFYGTHQGANDFECVIWADEPPNKHWRFSIGKTILEMLGGTSSIVPQKNVAVCNANRTRILVACEVAHNEQPDEVNVALQPHHFRNRS
jgi:hypothetical protein